MIYISYGSNMNQHQMANLCPNAVCLGKGILKDYKMGFYKTNNSPIATVYADVRYSLGDSCDVVIWSVEDTDIPMLDMFEGYPTLYSRIDNCVVETDTGILNGFLYKMVNNCAEDLPSYGYLKTVYIGYRQSDIPIENLMSKISLDEITLKNISRHIENDIVELI